MLGARSSPPTEATRTSRARGVCEHPQSQVPRPSKAGDAETPHLIRTSGPAQLTEPRSARRGHSRAGHLSTVSSQTREVIGHVNTPRTLHRRDDRRRSRLALSSRR